MTPTEAIHFAQAIPDTPYIVSALDTLESLLYVLERTTTTAQRQHAAQSLCDRAEYFRRSDTPGHQTWYHHHLHVAAVAARRWGTDKKKKGQTTA